MQWVVMDRLIKVIEGILHHSINTTDVFYQIFGDKTKIEPNIKKSDKLNNNSYEIIHTTENCSWYRYTIRGC